MARSLESDISPSTGLSTFFDFLAGFCAGGPPEPASTFWTGSHGGPLAPESAVGSCVTRLLFRPPGAERAARSPEDFLLGDLSAGFMYSPVLSPPPLGLRLL